LDKGDFCFNKLSERKDKMNLDYKKIYDTLQATKKRFQIIEKWDKRYQDQILAAYKKQFPRSKVTDLSKVMKKLPEETITSISEPLTVLGKKELDHKKRQEKLLDALLYSLSNAMEIKQTEEYRDLTSRSSYDYWSQGFGASTYAKNAVKVYLQDLEKEGIDCKIEERNVEHIGEWSVHSANYVLMAKIEPWQFDCILRRTKYDPLQWAVDCWKRGVNPKVYNPFLSDEIFDKSMAISMGRSS
jgi:hypothetical protein